MQNGKLYLVSTPIGNWGDISQRAIEVIAASDILVCEDLREGRRLLHQLKLEKPLLPLNEHTTRESTGEAIEHLRDGKSLALVSDAGTPLLADPGYELVRQAITEDHRIIAIPGASSILPALVVSGFRPIPFTFVGFLPREKDERKRAAASYRSERGTLIFLEAPYRLAQLLSDLTEGIGEAREAVLCMNLTMPTERIRRDTLGGLREYFAEHPFKGEFVLVVKGADKGKANHNAGGSRPPRRR